MQTFNEKLQAAQAEFLKDKVGSYGNYDKRAMPEVLAHCKAAQEQDAKKYYYNRALAEYIKEREQVAAELADYLDTEVYLAQHDMRAEKEAAYAADMVAQGWRKLDKAAIDDALAAGKRLVVNATATNDWCNVKIDNIYKPHIFARGTDREQYGLMKPKARTHGYALYQFENAFCKLV